MPEYGTFDFIWGLHVNIPSTDMHVVQLLVFKYSTIVKYQLHWCLLNFLVKSHFKLSIVLPWGKCIATVKNKHHSFRDFDVLEGYYCHSDCCQCRLFLQRSAGYDHSKEMVVRPLKWIIIWTAFWKMQNYIQCMLCKLLEEAKELSIWDWHSVLSTTCAVTSHLYMG